MKCQLEFRFPLDISSISSTSILSPIHGCSNVFQLFMNSLRIYIAWTFILQCLSSHSLFNPVHLGFTQHPSTHSTELVLLRSPSALLFDKSSTLSSSHLNFLSAAVVTLFVCVCDYLLFFVNFISY